VLFIAKGDKVLRQAVILPCASRPALNPKVPPGGRGRGQFIFADQSNLTGTSMRLAILRLSPGSRSGARRPTAASRAHYVSSDVVLLDAKRLGYQFATVLRQCTGRPHLQLAVFPVRRSACGSSVTCAMNGYS